VVSTSRESNQETRL